MHTNKQHTNADKCIFGAVAIHFPGCFIRKRGLRADLAKVKAIVDWPIPYNELYPDMSRPLSNLLKKDDTWCWDTNQQAGIEAIKESMLHAPMVALPDLDRPFNVIWDVSYFVIGCALLQADID
ncbi:Mary1-like Reverse transcriptase [Phytophthora megakarya]|uniref:Mary1-like Reverse transcriptase n=1 Tax=Phytophthora megakarya TaxID=4795 RepID=A0A225VVH1_9STRA|nr:Mary1-like Reverse transcriptase [Phytophthora megakarya]